MDAIFNAEPLVEVDQVRAATQQDVLAVVNGRAVIIGGIQRVRSGATAEKWARLKDRNSVTGRPDRQRCSEAREAASHNRDLRLPMQNC